MTLLDKSLEFSNGQALTATAVSTNDIDLGPHAALNAARDIGAGGDLFVAFIVTTALLAAGAATLNIQILTDDNSGFASPAVLYDSGAIPKASLVAGYTLFIPLPRGFEKFARLNYVVGTGPFTAGAVRAYITNSAQDNRSYAVGTPITG